MRIYLFTVICIGLIIGCSSTHKSGVSYHALIKKYSSQKLNYKGFDNTFSYQATLFNTNVQNAYINEKSRVYEWSPTQSSEELLKLQESNSSETYVWLSFYTPRPVDDNLHRKKSVWNIYIEANGQRYDGKATRDNTSRTETMALFQYHDSFATTYKVKFPVSILEIQNSVVKMTIAGPLGSKTTEFMSL